jgi:hypothetical protein
MDFERTKWENRGASGERCKIWENGSGSGERGRSWESRYRNKELYIVGEHKWRYAEG